MALAFDAVGPSASGQAATNPASLTWSHTVTGTNPVLLVGVIVGTSASDATKTISSVTYNGVSMGSALASRHAGDLAVGYGSLYGMIGPPTGAHNVVVTFNSAPNVGVAGSISYTGADQVAPFGTPVTSANTSATATLAVASNTSGNSIVYLVGCGSDTGTNPTSPATKRIQNNFSNSTGCGTLGLATIPATGSSVTCAWTVTSDSWVDLAVELKVASAGAAPDPVVVMAPMISGGM